MHIIDLTEEYQKKYIERKNRREYEDGFPELFKHYYQFWADSSSDIAFLSNKEIRYRKVRVNQHIKKLEKILNQHEIAIENIECILFIGVGTTNGHALRFKDKFFVWLPLETYTSEKSIQVFATHEIIHALHYQNSPGFYFSSKDEQVKISRQLITEGMATYLTAKLTGISEKEALWADYLNDTKLLHWWQRCHEEEQNLFYLIHDHYYESKHTLNIFYAANPDDIYKYRFGYYAGLRLIEDYASLRGLSPEALLGLPREKLEKDIFDLIQSYVKK